MARPIVWSDPAVDDLKGAVEFIAKDSEAYARTLAQMAVDAAESLGEFPNRGHRLRDPQLSRLRELINRVVPPYLSSSRSACSSLRCFTGIVRFAGA